MEEKQGQNQAKKSHAQGSETRRRNERITVRLDKEERKILEEAAERAGVTLGTYVRSRVLAPEQIKTRAVRRPSIEQEKLAQLLGQLGRVGGNIHQIAKRLNFQEHVANDEISVALSSFEEAAESIMLAMGRKRA